MLKPRYRSGRSLGLAIGSLSFLAASFLLPSAATAASPTITASPNSAVSGSDVTIGGTSWPGDDSIEVTLLQGGTSVGFVCFVNTDSTGVVEPQTCTVPTSVMQGSYTINASDNTLSAQTGFTINPGITALGFTGSPAMTLAAGQAIGLTGSGFAANASVSATFNGASVTLAPKVTTSSTGQLGGTDVTIPASTAAGAYPLAVKDSSGHTATIETDIYAATLTATPASGTSGASVTLSGSGWPTEDSVRIELNQGTTQNFVCFTTTDGNGTLAQTCTLPSNLTQGNYTLVGEDNSLAVSTAFTLNPGITVLGFTGSAASSLAAGQTPGLSGSGFAPSSALHASFNGSSVTLTPTTSTNTSGAFSSTGFTIPSATAAGIYPVTVTDASGHSSTVHVNVFAATIAATPATLVSGSTVSIAGTGWPANDSVRIELNQGTTQNFVCFSTTDGNGLLAQTCPVPTALIQGSYTLVGEDNSLAVSRSVTVDPGITVIGFAGSAATSVAAGQTAGLSGTGFAVNSKIKATFNKKTVTLKPAVTTSTNGQFSGTTFTVPASTAAGNFALAVKDASGHTATVHLNVFAATLSVSPTTGISGHLVTVSGTGWPTNDSVRIELNQGTTQNFVCFATTNGSGVLSQSCTVPSSLTEGSYTLVGEDNSLAVSTPFTLDAGISLTASNGQALSSAAPGTAAELAGSGFAANSNIVKVIIGTDTISFGSTPVTNSAGSFSGAAFTVPSLPAGTYTVKATDAAGNSATAQLIIT